MTTASAEYAVVLRQLADLAEIRGARADAADLRRAGSVLATLGPGAAERLARLERSERLAEIGINPALHPRIRELASGQAHAALAAARADLPSLLRRLLELPAVTTDQALRLARRLSVLTLADLFLRLDDGGIEAELGPEAARALGAAGPALDRERSRLTLGRAMDLTDGLMAALARARLGLTAIEAAGDLRRYETFVGDVTIVGTSPDPASVLAALEGVPDVERVLCRDASRALVLHRRSEVDVHVARPETLGRVLLERTGAHAHLAALGRRLPDLARTEDEAYAAVGLPYIAPELRNAQGEIEAARAGRLPTLVSRSDIRGDLHVHTTYSDGRDGVAAMVASAATLGYEYIAITDHSQRASASRTLTVDQLARQADEIARVREHYPGIAILHGIEVDVLAGGRLDFDDQVLEPLDIVLASLHDAAGHGRERLTARCLSAVRHPLVNVLTHPSNQIVGRRPPFDLDFEAIYAAAAEAGTALEIDGAPSHMDLDGERARAAISAGALVTIDSDGHRSDLLDRQMRIGVGLARRGWVEPRHVVNARPLAEVRAFVAAKRTGRR